MNNRRSFKKEATPLCSNRNKIFILVTALTLCRIPLSVLAYMEIAAGKLRIIYYLVLFLGIAVSDFLDGKLARMFHVHSTFGAAEDVFCDFFYIITAYYALYRLGFLPIWMLLLVTLKLLEFLLTSVFMRKAHCRRHIFIFDRTGRYTAIGFYVLPIIIVLCSNLGSPLFFAIRYILCISLLILTVTSTIQRLKAIIKKRRCVGT